jgi:predicted DNA-binding transcriptional regulator AlpA
MPKKKSSRPRLSSDPPPLRLLSLAEVCQLLGVSRVTVWTWQMQGRFPRSRNLNGQTRWFAHEVEQFLSRLPTTRLKSDDANA